MNYTEETLRLLAQECVVGDFHPFDSGEIDTVEQYIKKIVKKLQQNPRLIVEADFDYYGSGFASYINIHISKKDGSDSTVSTKNRAITTSTKGLLLYICNLAPVWCYGSSSWSKTTEDGAFKSSSGYFLTSKKINTLDNDALWHDEVETIKTLMDDMYGYVLLTTKEAQKPISSDIKIATVFSDPPFEVFDCFFHWED